MKAVVLEIRGNKAALLSDDGCVVKVKNENYEIGQEVSINMTKNISMKKKIAYFAASVAVVIGVGAATYYVPTTYVSMDVNPSIEYHVNMYDKVVSVEGVNKDGSEIIENVNESTSLKNKSIEDAIKLTVNEVAKEGYLNYDNSGIVIATSTGDDEKAEELAQSLEDTANEACENNDCDTTVEAEAVGKQRVEEARKLGVTPGKLNLVQKLIESSEDPDSIDQKTWLNKPVKDIMAKTKENKKQNKEQNTEQEKNAGETTKNQEKNKNAESNAKSDKDKGNSQAEKSKNNGNSNSGSTTNVATNSDNVKNISGLENSSNSQETVGTPKAGNTNGTVGSGSGSGSGGSNGKMGNN